MISILEAQQRSLRGPLIPELKFDMKYQRTLREVADKYCRQHFELKPDELIPIPEASDAVYEAALELISRVGTFHINSGRVIEFTHDEIDQTAKTCGKPVIIGEGREQVTMKPRYLGDPSVPVRFPGPSTAPFREEQYVPLHMSIIKLPEANGIAPGMLRKVGGFENKVGTPAELMNVFYEAQLLRDAIQRAGRPGFVIAEAPAGAVSPFALIASFSEGYYSKTDTMMPMHIYPGLKLDWDRLILAAFARQMGINPISTHIELRGLNVRDAWEAAIADIGGSLAYLTINGASATHGISMTKEQDPLKDLRYMLQAQALRDMALSRNGPVISIGMTPSLGGVGTKGGMYGSAYLSFGRTASGAGALLCSSFGSLDSKLWCEAAIAAAGIDRQEANKILDRMVTLMEKAGVARGYSFPDLYDMESLEPKDEYKKVYTEAKKDLLEIGVPFKY